jgi:hypothetical protein
VLSKDECNGKTENILKTQERDLRNMFAESTRSMVCSE